MRRLLGRTILAFGAYTAVLLAVVIAGFLSQAIGIWASVLWGAMIIVGVLLFGRMRRVT